jgi:hypothetical protein
MSKFKKKPPERGLQTFIELLEALKSYFSILGDHFAFLQDPDL